MKQGLVLLILLEVPPSEPPRVLTPGQSSTWATDPGGTAGYALLTPEDARDYMAALSRTLALGWLGVAAYTAAAVTFAACTKSCGSPPAYELYIGFGVGTVAAVGWQLAAFCRVLPGGCCDALAFLLAACGGAKE